MKPDHGNFLESVRARWQRMTAAELMVYLAVVVVLIGTWGFIELGNEMLEGETQKFDDWVLKSLRHSTDLHQPIGPRWLYAFFLNVTALGSSSIAVLIALTAAGALLLRRRRLEIGMIAIALTGASLLTAGLKTAFGRPRPPIEYRAVEAGALSFPSGHSFTSAVLYLTLGALLTEIAPTRAMKIYVISVAIVLTVLVGISRVYLGVHYATDVLGGWCAGTIWATVCLLAVHFLRTRRQRNTQRLPETK